MPPPVKRNICVIVYDSHADPVFLARAEQCLLDIYNRRWFAGSKDQVSLVVVGKEETGWKNFYKYDPKIAVNSLRQIQNPSADNWLTILEKAAKVLHAYSHDEKTARGVINYQLVYISDFSNAPSAHSDSAVQWLIQTLNSLNIYLYVLGVPVHISKTLMNWADVHNWSKNIRFIDVENPCLQVVRKIVQETKHAIVCDLEIGSLLFTYYQKRAGPQRLLLPLTIGSKVKLPANSFRCLKRLSYPKFPNRARYKTVSAENPEEEVDQRNTVRAYYICKKLIVKTPELFQHFKAMGERHFSLLGFAERNSISECLFHSDGTHRIVPGLDLHGAKMLKTFMLVLHEKNMCAIVRRRYIKNTKPKVYAMIPEADAESCFLVQLPFRGEVRRTPKEKDVEIGLDMPEVDAQLKENMFEYLNSLDVTSGTVCKLPLNLEMLHNPFFNKCAKFASQKYVGREIDAEEEEFMNFGDNSALNKLLDVWPKRVLTKNKTKKTASQNV